MEQRREPYDTGYADGWRESKPGVYKRRQMYRHRSRNSEYVLGYGHGRIDGRSHPDMPGWPDEWQTARAARSVDRSTANTHTPIGHIASLMIADSLGPSTSVLEAIGSGET